MSVVLGPNNYGKSQTRVVRVSRSTDEHELADLTVSVALAGDLAATHLSGDNSHVLPTDTQKNTVFAFARAGIGAVEEFGLRLARHFVDSQPSISRARVSLAEHAWRHVGPHSFVRSEEGTRTATVTYDGESAWVVSGIADLVLLNSTGSEFHGFVRDAYTTLDDAHDRILATVVEASWRYATVDDGWDWRDWMMCWRGAQDALIDAFVTTHSRSLQQTLFAMGREVIETRPEIAEVRLSLPNRHHFLVDLAPFGLDNPGEVFYAADRPYGLIEGTVCRDEAPAAGLAWDLHADAR